MLVERVMTVMRERSRRIRAYLSSLHGVEALAGALLQQLELVLLHLQARRQLLVLLGRAGLQSTDETSPCRQGQGTAT